MTTQDNEHRHKLEQTLIKAYRARQTPPWESGWNEGVMQEILRVARQPPSVGQHGGLAVLVWRTAGLAMALAMLLTVSSLLMRSPKAMGDEASLVAEDVAVDTLFLE